MLRKVLANEVDDHSERLHRALNGSLECKGPRPKVEDEEVLMAIDPKEESKLSHEYHPAGKMSRRKFIGWSSLAAGWARLPFSTPAASFGAPSGRATSEAKMATLLDDGEFERGGLGWQLGEGSVIVSVAKAPSPKVLYVKSHGTSTTRAIILSPDPGTTYTLHGFMRTSEVNPLEPGGCAMMSLNQFEFAGRQVAAKNFAKLTGTQGWTPFSFTFKCEPLVVWFELSLGMYRAGGEAWFANVTLVEGLSPGKSVICREAEPGYPTPKREALANVAIFRDTVPTDGTPSDPDALGRVLKEAGYEVEYLQGDELADPAKLDRQRVDILVLPYGPAFPAPAQKTLVSFLSQGGSFFSTGGYAFNVPLLERNGRWVSVEEVLAADAGTETVREGDFENTIEACTTAGWKLVNPSACSVDPGQAHDGRQSARVTLGEDGWWKDAFFEFRAGGIKDRDQFVFSCWAKTEDVSDRFDGYAYINLEQLDSSHGSIDAVKPEVVRLRGTNDWKLCQRATVVNPDAKWIRVRFGLSRAAGTLWVDGVSLRKKSPEIRINTARGNPNDELRITPDQIGVFDADYRLRRVAYLATAPNQEIVKTPLRVEGTAAGYAASGVLGTQNARWTPLVNAYDRYGRLRGAAGALMRHHNGFYRKSHWALFGVENRDLFPAGDPKAKALLLEVFDALQRKTFLHEARTSYESYRQGEPVQVFDRVSNFSSQSRKVSATVTIFGEPQREQVFRHTVDLELEPDRTLPVEMVWRPREFEARRYTVVVELSESGRKVDRVETGFLVWDETVLRNGFPLKYRDNYLRFNDRTIFMQGSDDYVHTFINRHENPKTWYEDISKYRDHFLTVYENLMGARGFDDVSPEARWRQIDAMIQICQECKLVFFPGLLIFGDTAVENSELRHQQAFCKEFAKRYGLSSALIYYLNGDLRLRDPNLPDLRAIFNDYLRRKYGSQERLAEAWHVSPPKEPMGSIAPLGGSERWEDVRTFDNFLFRVNVVRRWLDSMAQAIREIDPAHPITAEFYAEPWEGIDVVTAIGSLTLGNIGYFDVPGEDVYRFPATFRFMDMRARGKSINDGEFGVKTHPAWKDAGGYLVTRSEMEENQLYLAIPHYAVGLGGSKVQNWCWKYPADLPFEWGINYPCDTVSRDALLYYRNTGLFFRQFDLKYEGPEVLFLTADNHRMGGQGEAIRRAQLTAIRYLLDLHCDFASIDEFHLEELPSTCKVLIYPLPFCPDDAVIERLLTFVEGGGTLYVSGDISYDPNRKRTKTDRLGKLLGVKFLKENYPNIQFEGNKARIRISQPFFNFKDYEGYPCIQVKPLTAEIIAQTSDGQPVILTGKVGSGRVFYSTDVLELHAPARTTELGRMVYGSFLEWAGVKRPALRPDDPFVHLFRSVTSRGEELFTLVNRDDSAPSQQIRFSTSTGEVRLDVAQRMTGAVAITGNGAIQSVETSGTAEGRGETYCRAEPHVMLFALDREDLRQSKALCLLPMGEGQVRIRNTALKGLTAFELGEFQDGAWKRLEDGQLNPQDGWIGIDITSDRNLGIVLIAATGDMESAVEKLTKLLEFQD